MKKIDNEMLALIMIGGQSKRMGGGIKSFIEFNHKSLLDRIIERASPQVNKMIINCNNKNKKLLKYDMPVIADLKQNYLGPLAGIHSAMNWIINNEPQIKWLVSLPGDTPFIPKNLISSFKKKITSKSKIILAQSNNKIHPVIGAWHTSLFENLDNNLDQGVRKIMSWAKMHPIDYIDYSIENYDPFFNINSKDDINIAIEIERNFFS